MGAFLAASLALIYAWLISQTEFVQTGVQFVSPVLIVLTVHLAWLTFAGGLNRGFSAVIFGRAVRTVGAMAVLILGFSLIAPEPASAGLGEVLGGILGLVFCVAVLAAVAFIAIVIVRQIILFFQWCFGGVDDDDDGGNSTRLFDFASLGLGVLLICLASAEGVTSALTLDARNSAQSVRVIEAPTTDVWQAMETATSPQFPLPKILAMFPRPVRVEVDQGTKLGALRRVAFAGREGAGHLTLQVVDRDNQRAVFEVQSDTSPYAQWIGYKTLTYQVAPMGADRTQLIVRLDFDRKLAPAWIFNPMTKAASYFAMDVLARDVKTRSEG